MAITVSTKFMIISDTHNFQFGDAEKCDGHLRQPTPRVDVLLHAGDLTGVGGPEYYKRVLKFLGAIDAELKLVIAGNHDKDLDREHWKTLMCEDDEPEDHEQPDRAIEVMTGPLAREAGVTYLEEGLNTFTLSNGATFTIYTSPYQPEFCNWAFPYERNQDRFNPLEHVAPGVKSIATPTGIVPDFPDIDIMMTHGPPQGILDWTAFENLEVGCEALLRAVSRARPLLYCFGHIHEAYGSKVITWNDDETKIGKDAIERETDQPNAYPNDSSVPLEFGKQTQMVNASIMNLNYRPTNAPWILNLDLPKTN